MALFFGPKIGEDQKKSLRRKMVFGPEVDEDQKMYEKKVFGAKSVGFWSK